MKSKIIIPITILCCLAIVVTTHTSKSKYVYVDSIPIIDGTVNYTPYQYKIIKQYKQKDDCTDTSSSNCYEEVPIDTVLTDYELNAEKTYYYIDYEEQKQYNQITLNADGSINASNLPMRSKCFLYFDKKSPTPVEQIIASSKGTLPETFTSLCDNTDCSGLYEAPDDDGTSYYFRGTVDNNYVKFGKIGNSTSGADIWWRIIRINGDGSIRMIFAGTGTGSTAPTQIDKGTMINNGETYTYSPDGAYNDNKYVGFEYQDNIRNGNSKGSNGQKSNALQKLETWFRENLEDELEAGYIDENAGFCADRTAYEYSSPYNRNDNLGTVKQSTYYGGYIRTVKTHQPTFICEDKDHDLFTYENANQGTKSLAYPIGLITVDEEIYAGGFLGWNNGKYYLYNGKYYWTMSPSYFNDTKAYTFRVSSSGNVLGAEGVFYSSGVRPILNLKSDVLKSGNGSSSNPFKTTS